MTHTDIEFLRWIYDRMLNEHNEKHNVDYMIAFKDLIEKEYRNEKH